MQKLRRTTDTFQTSEAEVHQSNLRLLLELSHQMSVAAKSSWYSRGRYSDFARCIEKHFNDTASRAGAPIIPSSHLWALHFTLCLYHADEVAELRSALTGMGPLESRTGDTSSFSKT